MSSPLGPSADRTARSTESSSRSDRPRSSSCSPSPSSPSSSERWPTRTTPHGSVPKDALDYESFLLRMATHASMTTPVTGVATHPEDDPILATAVSARADYLVTGDQPLRRVGAIANIPIISPADFVTILDSQR